MSGNTSPSGEQFELVSGPVRAVVVEVGGGLRELVVEDRWLVDGYGADEICPACAGQVLLPWPNRIGDGRYTFGGQEHQLPLTEPARHNAIHGLVRWLPWTVLSRGADQVELGCTLFPSPGYPFGLRLRTRWSVSERGLRAEHHVENVGDQRAPLGFGVHPYLGVPGRGVDDLWLHLPAKTLIRTDDRLLPLREEPVGEMDFQEPRSLRGVQLDTAFGGLTRAPDGTVTASLRDADGRGVELRADAGTRWWQVYTSDTLPGARYRRSVAIEPMTCPPNAFHTCRDLQVLAPGESWSGWWELGERI
jgi:aldose 1-epimerase